MWCSKPAARAITQVKVPVLAAAQKSIYLGEITDLENVLTNWKEISESLLKKLVTNNR